MDGPVRALGALSAFPLDLLVLQAGVRAILSLAGCLKCRCYHSRASQEVMGSAGAVEALLDVIGALLRSEAELGDSCAVSITEALQVTTLSPARNHQNTVIPLQ